MVEDEGNTIEHEVVDSIRDCERLCDAMPGCESLTYCQDSSGNQCYLKDKPLTGVEPTLTVDELTASNENCSSYYTLGIF